MLTVTILGEEYFDDESETFVYPESIELQLEHSLVSLSKWETEFEKPFLDGKERTEEEAFGYLHHMILTPNVPREVVHMLTEANILEINEYINQKQTATWFAELPVKRTTNEIITNELIYYWMSTLGIPQECETWHLNRLFTRIKVHSAKNEKPKKMTSQEQAQSMREANERRRAKYNSTG